MEPVILMVSIAAIISTTYLKAKRMNLEKERIRLGVGVGEYPHSSRKKNILGFAKGFFTTVNDSSLISKANNFRQKENKELNEVKKRLENLETILVDSLETNTIAREKELQTEINRLNKRLNDIESS